MAGQHNRSAAHIAYWHGSKFSNIYPQLQPPPDLPRRLPEFMGSVAELLEEVAVTGLINVAALSAATAKEIYTDFMFSPPPPCIEAKQNKIDWHMAWPRVWSTGLQAAESDLLFRLLHNVLPVRARIARLDPNRSDGQCPHCPGQQETTDHLFVSCPRVADLWLGLFFNLLPTFREVSTNPELLRLAFGHCDREGDVVATLATYISLIWATRLNDQPPRWADFLTALWDRPPPYRPPWALKGPP